MKKKILFLFFSLMLTVGLAFGDVDTKDGIAITTTSNIDGFTSNIDDYDGQVVSAGETLYRSCDDTGNLNKWYVAADPHNNTFQEIESGTGTVSKVEVYLCKETGDEDVSVHIEIWDTTFPGGSQIGGDSNSQTVTGNCTVGSVWYTFTWAASNPTMTNAYRLVVVDENTGDANNVGWCVDDDDDTCYDDTTYEAYGGDWRDEDFIFKIYIQ